MRISEDEIVSLIEMIWQTSLGLSVQRAAPVPSQFTAEGTYLGCAHISGEWQGVVMLQCPSSLVRKIARIMFELGDREPLSDELHDALSEITNMTGGNIKSLLPGPCFLSMPTVVDGDDYRLRVPGTVMLDLLVFQCNDAQFVVSLLQKEGLTGISDTKTSIQ
jgi:chemotaxis protein CheX